MASQEDIRKNLEERIKQGKPIDWNLALKQQNDYLSYLVRLPKGNPTNEVEIEKTYKILNKILTGELVEGMEKRIKIKRHKEVISRIFLEHLHYSHDNWVFPTEAISIIELGDRVEVLRFNLEDRPSPDLDKPSLFMPEINKNRIVYGGIMPKEEYSDLFNYLERRNVWELGPFSPRYFESGSNNLFISKNQKKYAFRGYDTYNLLNLANEKINTRIPVLLRDIPLDEKYAALKFLKISKKICDVSKKYAKTKAHNNQNLYKNQ